MKFSDSNLTAELRRYKEIPDYSKAISRRENCENGLQEIPSETKLIPSVIDGYREGTIIIESAMNELLVLMTITSNKYQ